ncbi:hypothetical protein SteCoe_33116 [Stentor coeruleus]|uniref:Uncharacterized protein n=1 Tax=Stentor coeruleus TaxID=5963 RepID=A0A1R2AXX4_9CILI|nr:hypothetical protein SteCoe_33116 [Stentor coeruleus]
MEISRTIRDDLAKEFGFITSDKKQDLPSKRSRSRSSTPQPKTSARSQLDKLKMTLDMEARQKKVEEFKKKQEEKKKMTAKTLGETEIKTKPVQAEVQIVKENKLSANVDPIILHEHDEDLIFVKSSNPQKIIEIDKKEKDSRENRIKSLCITKVCDFKCNTEKEKYRGRQKGLRNEFPKRLLEEYPFLRSPDRKNEMIFKLFDSKSSRYEIREAIGRISSI